VSSPKKKIQSEKPPFHASAVLVNALNVVESAAPPFGTLVCST
jgi:hypothetical protein